MSAFNFKRVFRIAAYGLLIAVIGANLLLFLRVLKGTHYSPTDPTKTETGAFTDLYPRWHGAKEMIFHRRSPYSDGVTLENQRASCGAFNPNDGASRDPLGFAYPATVAVPLLPLLLISYRAALLVMGLFCVSAIAWGLLKWLRWLSPEVPIEWRLIIVAVAMGLQPSVSTVLLCQPGIFAFVGLTMAMCCLREGKQVQAGLWLALAATKPQMAAFVLVGLHIWAIADWKKYYKIILSFWVATSAAIAFCCLFDPKWLLEWPRALGRYQEKALAFSIIDFWIRKKSLMWAIKIAAAVPVLMAWLRRKNLWDTGFGVLFSISLCLSLLVLPAGHIYNHIFIYPLWFLCIGTALPDNRPFNAVALTGCVGAFLLWTWSTIPLAVRNIPSLAQSGLGKELLIKFNGMVWPWNLVLLTPVLLFLTSLYFCKSREAIKMVMPGDSTRNPS